MCYPMIALAVGGVMSAVGAIRGGQAEEAYAKANADMMEMKAKDAKERAEIEGMKIRRKGEAMKGRQMAQMASGGVVIDADGTTGDLLADTEMITELDALTAINNGEKESYYHTTSALNERAKGKNAKKAGYIQGFGTLLATAGSLGTSFASTNTELASAGQAEMGFGEFMTQSVFGVKLCQR